MLKITLPIEPLDLAYSLFSCDKAFVDLELAKIYKCDLFIGSHVELNTLRKKLKMGATSYEPFISEVNTQSYISEGVLSIQVHNQRANLIGQLINSSHHGILNNKIKVSISLAGDNLIIKRESILPPVKEEKRNFFAKFLLKA